MVFMYLFREINPKQSGSWKRRQCKRGEETHSLTEIRNLIKVDSQINDKHLEILYHGGFMN